MFNPVLTYVLPIDKCNNQQVLVNQIFLLNPSVGPQPTPSEIVEVMIDHIEITIPSNSERTVLYDTINQPGGIILSYDSATGRITYLHDILFPSPNISVIASSSEQATNLQVILYRQNPGQAPIQLDSTPLIGLVSILDQTQDNIFQGTQFFVALRNATNTEITVADFSCQFRIEQPFRLL